MDTDKRKHLRFNPQGLSAKITIVPLEPADEITLQGTVVDMSYSGIKIKLSAAIPENISQSKIRIDMKMPGSGIPITIRGVIKHWNDDSVFGLHYSHEHPENEVDDLMFECIKYARVYSKTSRNLGMTPKSYHAEGMGESISYASRNTALGVMLMAATDRGICFVQFDDNEASLITTLKDEYPKAELIQSPAQDTTKLDLWMDVLDKHISQGAVRPDLPLDMRGTAFQMKIWTFLLSIREGDILSYSELAEKINKPKAARAVASACAKNRIGVLIPCHRILRSDGSLGGYRWGLERKRALLETERKRRNS